MLTIVGVFGLFATLIIGLASVAGDALLMMAGVGPVIDYLGTGQGVLAGFAVSVFMILLGVGFLTRAAPQATASATVIQGMGASQAERDRELESLQKRLRKAEQENKRLRTFLADPKAVKRREDEMLRKRYLELAHEVRSFALTHKSRYGDQREAVERFMRRHYPDVEEAREEMDERGWITGQERDDLTISADDRVEKIEQMANVLGNIATKR